MPLVSLSLKGVGLFGHCFAFLEEPNASGWEGRDGGDVGATSFGHCQPSSRQMVVSDLRGTAEERKTSKALNYS